MTAGHIVGQNDVVSAPDLAVDTIDTPVGRLWVRCSAVGVAAVHFGRVPRPPGQDAAPSAAAQSAAAQSATLAPIAATDLARATCAQLDEYFGGLRRDFDLPVDWGTMSGTRRQVLSVLAGSVRYGQTITYGALARRAWQHDDAPALPARVIGQVMGSNPLPVLVPCHRVVAADGLGGYSGGTGPEVKRWLLTLEGALPPTLDWEPVRSAAR